jgi:hypothetical protein
MVFILRRVDRNELDCVPASGRLKIDLADQGKARTASQACQILSNQTVERAHQQSNTDQQMSLRNR